MDALHISCPQCGEKKRQRWVSSRLVNMLLTRATMRCSFCNTEYEVSVYRDVPSPIIAAGSNHTASRVQYQYALPGIPKEKK
jgi:uncharacterized Zn finger protein